MVAPRRCRWYRYVTHLPGAKEMAGAEAAPLQAAICSPPRLGVSGAAATRYPTSPELSGILAHSWSVRTDGRLDESRLPPPHLVTSAASSRRCQAGARGQRATSTSASTETGTPSSPAVTQTVSHAARKRRRGRCPLGWGAPSVESPRGGTCFTRASVCVVPFYTK